MLDQAVPLAEGSWADVTDVAGAVLADPAQYKGKREGEILFAKNGLHIRVVIDPSTPVGGASDPAGGISDVILESALSAIMDCEDSVAAVDAEDKVLAYSNWLGGLMDGSLTEEVEKGGKSFTRKLNDDLSFEGGPDGPPVTLKGRALMLVRNVGGHLMTNPAILDGEGREVGEGGLMDAMVTTLCAMHDLGGREVGTPSRARSMW